MASVGVVARDSQARSSLQPSGVLDPSHQTVASSFSDIGIVLPSVHLGSFTTMTFDSLPRTASTSRASSPDKRQRPPPTSDFRSPSSLSGVRQVTDNNNSRPTQSVKQGVGELTSINKRLSSASRSSRVSSSRMFDQTNSSSSMSVPVESIEQPPTPSTLAGGSYIRMLPTPIPSTVSSSQTPRTSIRESPTSPQQPQSQPRRQAPTSLPPTSLSSAEEGEQNDSLNNNAPLPTTSSTSVNGRTDRERVEVESGTPQLKVVNGQHSRRVESVDYASQPPYENNGSWVASPTTSAPYSNGRSASRNSSPPRGAALPDPSSSMYATQALSYPGPSLPPPELQGPSLPSPSSPQALSHQRPSRSHPPASLSQSSSQAGPRQSYSFPPAYNTGGGSAAQPPSQPKPPQAQYVSRPQPTLPISNPSQSSPAPIPVVQAQAAQRVMPPEEVCIECMMRDRDMADVDVTSPGVWERESDVWYEELVRRELKEARRGIVPTVNSNKPKSKGDPLTEANLGIWLTKNPKEPAARWQTLEKYVKAQAELLAAENDARENTLREARTQDSRMRDIFQHVRRSTGVDTATRISMGDSSQRGVKLRASTAFEDVDPYGNPIYSGYTSGSVYPSSSTPSKRRSRSKERDVTLLESGLIVERVDIQKEEREERARQRAEEKEERRRTRKISRVSVSGFGSPLSDASSMHSISAPIQGVNYSGSRSQISLAGGSVNGTPGSLASSAKRVSSPFALIPRPPMPRGTSQSSAESRGAPRFLNFKRWSGAFGSEASLHNNSGSMMDMHLGLEQDREMVIGAHEEQNWTINQLVDEPECAPEESVEKDKRGSIGRLWKKMTGSKDKDARRAQKKETQQVEDLNVPLDPPPPLSYLVARTPHERSPQRHVSSPSRQSLVVPGLSHPRSMSAPSNGYPPLPMSAGSATSFPIPSSPSTGASQPRYSPRNSVGSGDERRFSLLGANEGMPQFVPVVPEDGMCGPQDKSVNMIYRRQDVAPFSSHDPYGNEWGMSQSRISAQTLNDPSRPMSTASTDKELPPLPGGARPPVPQAARSFPVLRPITSYEFLDYHPPMAPFKSDVRRQSFSDRVGSLFGISRSRQNSDAGLVPPPRFATVGGIDVEYGYHYDEFGASTPSLGRWTSRTDDGREIPVTKYSLATPKKDKRSSRTQSRGLSGRLSAIFSGGNRNSGGDASHGREGVGRRSMEWENQLQSAINGNELGLSDGERYVRQSTYPLPGGRPASRSEVELRESVSSLVTFPRHSVASSRRYETVIPQERDFIAMRYPTESERLNLMRQS